jgi:hypothetical protein
MNYGRPDTFPVEITSVVKSVSIQAESIVYSFKIRHWWLCQSYVDALAYVAVALNFVNLR